MSVLIKPMESSAEIEGKAYVHWKSWQETYKELLDSAYLDGLTLKKYLKIACQRRENILVAKDGERVIGFVGYAPYREDSLPDTGEVVGLYVLSAYHGKKVGYHLLQAALRSLSGYPQIALWVLKGNERAIRFYKKCGFQFDGAEKPLLLGKESTELRMILVR